MKRIVSIGALVPVPYLAHFSDKMSERVEPAVISPPQKALASP